MWVIIPVPWILWHIWDWDVTLCQKYVFWAPARRRKYWQNNFCTRCGLKPENPEREMLGNEGTNVQASRWEAAILCYDPNATGISTGSLRQLTMQMPLGKWCCLTTISYGSSTPSSQQRQRIKQHCVHVGDTTGTVAGPKIVNSKGLVFS